MEQPLLNKSLKSCNPYLERLRRFVNIIVLQKASVSMITNSRMQAAERSETADCDSESSGSPDKDDSERKLTTWALALAVPAELDEVAGDIANSFEMCGALRHGVATDPRARFPLCTVESQSIELAAEQKCAAESVAATTDDDLADLTDDVSSAPAWSGESDRDGHVNICITERW